MKEWIRNKLRGFLGIEKVEDNIEILVDLSNERHQRLNARMKDVEETNLDVINTSNALLNQFNLSVDHYPHENHSWAVISIQGKPEYVKFIDLSRRDALDIHSFIKRYERTNRTIDSPFQIFKW